MGALTYDPSHKCGSSLCITTGLDLGSVTPEYKLIFKKKIKIRSCESLVECLWLIPIDSFAVSGPCVSGFKHVAYIGCKYSLHHHVAPHGEKVPIFTSRPSSGPSCTLLLRLACWRCGTAGRPHLFGSQGDSSREARPRRLGRGDHRLPIDGVCS